MLTYTTNHDWAYAIGQPEPAALLVWYSAAGETWIVHDEAVGRPLVASMYQWYSRDPSVADKTLGREAKAIMPNSAGSEREGALSRDVAAFKSRRRH